MTHRTKVLATSALLLAALAALIASPASTGAQAFARRVLVEGYQDIFTAQTAGDSNVDNVSAAVNADQFKTACIEFSMLNTTTPAGTLRVEGRVGTSGNYVPLKLDRVHGTATGVTHTAGETDIAISSPAANVLLLICVADPPTQIRTNWDNTSGGAVDTINVEVQRKGI